MRYALTTEALIVVLVAAALFDLVLVADMLRQGVW